MCIDPFALAYSQATGTFELAESLSEIFTVLPSSETVEGEESNVLAYCAIQLNERALKCLLEKALPIYVRCHARVVFQSDLSSQLSIPPATSLLSFSYSLVLFD